jgi:PEP-CTERM motif-containing protein
MHVKNLFLSFKTIAVVAVLTMQIGVANALLFNLNCEKDDTGGINTCTATDNWGTVSINDNAGDSNKVDVFIDLVDTAAGDDPHKVLQFYLNIVDSIVPAAPSWTVTGATNSVIYDPVLGVGSPVFLKFFDLQFPDSGNIGFEPITVTLGLGSVDLNPVHFDTPATLDNGVELFAEVHIGNCGPGSDSSCTPGTPGEGSIKVGSLGGGGGDPTGQIPEPMSLLLFGAGLISIAFVRRRNSA